MDEKRFKELRDIVLNTEDDTPAYLLQSTLPHSGTSRYAIGSPQNFDFIINNIKDCHNLSMCCVSDKGIGLAVLGTNGYCTAGDREDVLSDRMDYVRKYEGTVHDICITNSGKAFVLFNINGYSSYNAPNQVLEKIKKIPNSDRILSVSFNDSGEYIIVTESMIYMTTTLSSFVDAAQRKYGPMMYASIGELGRIAICSQGIYHENIPSTLVDGLNMIKFKPKVIHFTDSGSYCISDTDGNARYLL